MASHGLIACFMLAVLYCNLTVDLRHTGQEARARRFRGWCLRCVPVQRYMIAAVERSEATFSQVLCSECTQRGCTDGTDAGAGKVGTGGGCATQGWMSTRIICMVYYT